MILYQALKETVTETQRERQDEETLSLGSIDWRHCRDSSEDVMSASVP
jgi:hypothetical protein